MATDCVSMLRGRMMRLTKLDECGAPVEGAGSTLTASAFVSGTFTPNYQDPTETTVLDAAGNLCIDDRSPCLGKTGPWEGEENNPDHQGGAREGPHARTLAAALEAIYGMNAFTPAGTSRWVVFSSPQQAMVSSSWIPQYAPKVPRIPFNFNPAGITL